MFERYLPPVKGAMGRPSTPHRPVVEGIVYRYRTGIAWRDLPGEFGPWQTVWKRHHKWSSDGTWDRVMAEVLADSDAAGVIDWKVPRTPRSSGRISTGRTSAAPQARRPTRAISRGACRNDKKSRARRDEPGPSGTREPADHGLGRSRGGLSTKVHLLVDNRGRPLVVVVSPGQAGDNPALLPMLDQLRVARRGPGRPRTRPDLLRADKAYSARGTRAHLRRRGIKAVIPEPSDQSAHRKRRGSRGGRPVTYDQVEYRGRNSIERGIAVLKQWRAIATRYDKHALTYRGGLVLAAILTWLR